VVGAVGQIPFNKKEYESERVSCEEMKRHILLNENRYLSFGVTWKGDSDSNHVLLKTKAKS